MAVDSIIIGAGLSGLMVARKLRKAGQSVIVLEKSRGVGGRMATRRTDVARFDHGAQFYTRQEPLEEMHQAWTEKDLASPWFAVSPRSYFKCATGMTALAKELALDLDVRFAHRVAGLERRESRWSVTCADQSALEGSRVILTAPLPQALELLEQNHVTYPTALKTIAYAKAIVALFEFSDSGVKINDRGYAEPPSKLIFSIADQRAKGVSAVPAWTVSLKPESSEDIYDHDEESLIDTVFAELLNFYPKIQLRSAQIKKWRYAQPLTTYSELFIDLRNDLYLIGDGFGGPSLNGAARSANALIDTLVRNSGSTISG